jgi:hypothetical protein
MAKCANCNNEVASDASLCPNCGKHKPASTESHIEALLPFLLLCFIGCLFAPALASLAQSIFEIKDENMPKFKIFLWIIAIVSWTILIVVNCMTQVRTY